jgi:hypothetical protein
MVTFYLGAFYLGAFIFVLRRIPPRPLVKGGKSCSPFSKGGWGDL